MENKLLTHHDLCQFTGDLERFRHWLCRRVIYTPGVHYLAERGQAHWLLDAIVFYFGSNDTHHWEIQYGGWFGHPVAGARRLNRRRGPRVAVYRAFYDQLAHALTGITAVLMSAWPASGHVV